MFYKSFCFTYKKKVSAAVVLLREFKSLKIYLNIDIVFNYTQKIYVLKIIAFSFIFANVFLSCLNRINCNRLQQNANTRITRLIDLTIM